MILVIPFAFLWTVCLGNEDDFYIRPPNVTRSTLAGVQAYRSALTLDWLAAEDQRQRELASNFVTQIPAPSRSISTECIGYPRPASGKVARLMLELLKNLEGDESMVVTELIQALVRSKMLIETSTLEAEPDLESLVKTPGLMMGEPHITFPRILAMAWMTVSDPVTTKKFGWCPLQKLNKYLATTKSMNIANHMRGLEPILSRARYIMEEFIQHVTPLNIYEKQPASSTPGVSPLPSMTMTEKMEPTPELDMPVRESLEEPDALPQHSESVSLSRTFRRLIASTRATRPPGQDFEAPQVEMSRVSYSPPSLVDMPSINAIGPESGLVENGLSGQVGRESDSVAIPISQAPGLVESNLVTPVYSATPTLIVREDQHSRSNLVQRHKTWPLLNLIPFLYTYVLSVLLL